MKATQNLETGKVTVTYTATHTNHQLSLMECKHLPIPKSVKEKVKTMLANGVQMEKIMDGMYVCSYNIYSYSQSNFMLIAKLIAI